MDDEFQRDLAAVLNKHSIDAEMNIPDFALAAMLRGFLSVLHGVSWPQMTPQREDENHAER